MPRKKKRAKTLRQLALEEYRKKNAVPVHKGLIEDVPEVRQFLKGVNLEKIPSLKYLKAVKPTEGFIRQMFSSISLMTMAELKRFMRDSKVPIIQKIVGKLFMESLRSTSRDKLEFLLTHACQIDIHSGDKEETVQKEILVLPDPENYSDEQVIEHATNIKSIDISDYEVKRESETDGEILNLKKLENAK